MLRERRQRLAQVVPELVGRSKSAGLVLVDRTTWASRLAADRTSPAFLARLGIPVIALDVWDLEAPGLERDRDAIIRAPRIIEVSARCCPCHSCGRRGATEDMTRCPGSRRPHARCGVLCAPTSALPLTTD